MLSAALRAGLHTLATTWRVDVTGAEHLARLRAAGVPRIVVLWHRAAVPLLWWHRHQGTALLVSRNRDGALLAEAARAWGYDVVRGSTSRGGTGALRELIRLLERGREVAITPDGPRGPGGVAQPGAWAAARATGARIVAVGLSSSASWRLGSWDAVRLPRPFARVRLAYGAPLVVDASPRGKDDVQGALDATERAACA